MKIGIIGAGFSGLSVAHYLSKTGNEITLIEAENKAGGLARGFKEKEWEWNMDMLIHHWFDNEEHALGLVNELGLNDRLIVKSVKSSCYRHGTIAEMDSAYSLLKLPFLSLFNRIRTGVTMAYLRMHKNWKRYESETSYSLIQRLMGKNSFEVLWKPLMIGKFGRYAEEVNGAWFWGRVNPRTKKLAYFAGGIQEFVNLWVGSLKKKGVKVILNERVEEVEKRDEKFIVKTNKRKIEFDIAVMAVPLYVFLRVTKGLPFDYVEKLSEFKSLACQYLVLETNESIVGDDTYWLNVNDENFPFMIVAEHTNFVDKNHYNNKHMTYVGKYLEKDDEMFDLSKEELTEKIVPYLKKINKNFEEDWIKRSYLFRFDEAQPILPLNYSKNMIRIETPIKNLYMINMFQVYPFDRGTNAAIELGKKVAEMIDKAN